jgi:hypothetical protein
LSVDGASLELHPRTPLELRLFDRVPLPTFFVGLAIGIGVFACFLVYTALFGSEIGNLGAVRLVHGWAAELLQDLFLGFTLAVEAASVRGALRDLEKLRPWLGPKLRDREALRRVALHYRPLPLLAAGLVVGAGSAFATILNPSLWSGGRMPGWAHPAVLWLGVRNFLNWAIVARAMLLELMLGSAFSRLGAALEPDLLDRARFEPFGRRALRNVSLWLLLIAFLSLNFAGRGWAIPGLMALGMLFLGGFALAAFAIPLLGPHRRLRDAKRDELSRVRAALREARDRALSPDAADSPSGGRLADLVAYEQRVAAASEWPIETSTVVRFALFLALGLGSWVGAGLVQHGIEAALR